jgi:hypothetical protein
MNNELNNKNTDGLLEFLYTKETRTVVTVISLAQAQLRLRSLSWI